MVQKTTDRTRNVIKNKYDDPMILGDIMTVRLNRYSGKGIFCIDPSLPIPIEDIMR